MKLLKQDYSALLSYFLLLIALLPWFIVQVDMSINANLAYLTISALRLLSGESMSEGYYDTNPPLSILVQIPPALLFKITGLPIYYAVFAYGLLMVAFSTLAVHLVLKKTGWLTPEQRRVLLIVYILINTVGAGLYLGERDHLVALALFPLVLVQAATTYKIVLDKRLIWGVIGAGSILLLLKPHYGLVPLALFAHRLYIQKRLSIFKDPDFIGLAGGLILYVFTILIFFPDFVRIILPDVVLLYALHQEIWVTKLSVSFAFVTLAFAGTTWLLFDKPLKHATALLTLSALCIVPYGLQSKGFFYHALPAVIFASCGFSLLLERLFYVGSIKANLERFSSFFVQTGTILAAIALLYTVQPPNRAYPAHEDYRDSQFAKIINECKKPDCTFFLFNDMIEITQQLAVYTGQNHASRFPALWFLPPLLKANYDHSQWREGDLTPKQVNMTLRKYAEMIREDFRKYQPDTLIIGHFENITKSPQPFNFVYFFSERYPDFRDIMTNYERTDRITVDRSKYFGGTLFPKDSVRYDIYKKKDSVKNTDRASKKE